MHELEIRLSDQDGYCEPGAKLAIPIAWRFDEEQSGLELRVVWNAHGKGSPNLGVVHTESVEHPSFQGSRTIHVELPQAPYSFSGTLVSIVWALELVAQPSQVSTRHEIVIAPQGREVSMTSTSAEQEAW